jgi:probable rRNA maturation factor
MTVMVDVVNRSGIQVEEDAVTQLVSSVLDREGIANGELGLSFVPPEEIRELKRKHLGVDEATDVLAFPLDGREELPDGVPRHLGDLVLCPQVVGEAWQEPLVHGLLHLLGHDHGAEMEARERSHLR